MNHSDIEEMLRRSLQDGKLSRAEKSALKSVLADSAELQHERDWFRNCAFATARDSLLGPDARQAVDWLEDITGLLVTSERHDGPARQPAAAEVLFSPGDSCRLKIQQLFQMARHAIDICVFTITDDRITRAILEAHQRGCQVRVLSDNDKATDPGNDLDRIQQHGIPVRYDATPNHMHHKFAVFDRTAVVTGSYNWTRSAADDNHENLVVLRDASIVSAFLREFDRLWTQFRGADQELPEHPGRVL